MSEYCEEFNEIWKGKKGSLPSRLSGRKEAGFTVYSRMKKNYNSIEEENKKLKKDVKFLENQLVIDQRKREVIQEKNMKLKAQVDSARRIFNRIQNDKDLDELFLNHLADKWLKENQAPAKAGEETKEEG